MGGMRVEVGVKDSFKKKWVRSTWASHIEKWEMKNWQRAYGQKVDGGLEARKTDIGMEVCIKSNFERMGESNFALVREISSYFLMYGLLQYFQLSSWSRFRI